MKTPNLNIENHSEASYMRLRRFIGALGILMPIILIFGTMVINASWKKCGFNFWESLQPSLSHYYYSIMHIIFVGMLFLLGSFLITYKGKLREEKIVSTFAGICAYGVAIFPTIWKGFNCPECYMFLQTQYGLPYYIGTIHFIFAAILLLLLLYFVSDYFQ